MYVSFIDYINGYTKEFPVYFRLLPKITEGEFLSLVMRYYLGLIILVMRFPT